MIGKTKLRSVIKQITPPFIMNAARSMNARFGKPEWQYMPTGWEAAKNDRAIKGWDQQSVLKAYQDGWSDFVKGLDGTGPLGISPESTSGRGINVAQHNVLMTYAYALDTAAIGKTSISILDWGGGIGHYYLISKALRPDLQLDYHCKDLEVFVEYGRGLLPDVKFYSSSGWELRTYDLMIVSSSLQYSENWRETLTQLAHAAHGYVFITRTPTVQDVSSFVVVQRPYSYGYNTEYLGWCLNRKEVLECASSANLELIREFVVEVPPYIHGAPEQCNYWGYLFRKSLHV